MNRKRPAPPPPLLMKISEAAQVLEVAPQTVRRWVKTNQIRSVLLPTGHMRVFRADIVKILTNNRPHESDSPNGG